MQVLESPHAIIADVPCGPEDKSFLTQERSLQPKSSKPVPLRGSSSHPDSPASGPKKCREENCLPPASAASAEPGTAVVQAHSAAAGSAMQCTLPNTPLPECPMPLGQHQKPSAAGPFQGRLSNPELSGLKVQLRSPCSAPAQSPCQQLTTPRLKAASASKAGQTTPTLAGRVMSKEETPTAEQPPSLQYKRNSPSACVRMQPDPKAIAGTTLSPAHSAAASRTPGTLMIPQLKATPGGRLGGSTLAFLGLSPAAAQTPLLKRDPGAGQTDVDAGHDKSLDNTWRPDSLAANTAGTTPAQVATAAGDAGTCQLSATTPSAQSAARQAFGSPLCIEETPQQSNTFHWQHAATAPAAGRNNTASVAATAAPSASTQQTAPALASSGIKDTPALPQPSDAAHQSSTEGSCKEAVPASQVSRRARKSAKSRTAQQENSAAELGQQPITPMEGRQPLTAMCSGAMNQGNSKEGSRKTKKKERQTGSAAAAGSQSLSTAVIAPGNAVSSESRLRQPVRPAACPMAIARADVGTKKGGRRRPRKAGPVKPFTGVICLSSGGEIHPHRSVGLLYTLWH